MWIRFLSKINNWVPKTFKGAENKKQFLPCASIPAYALKTQLSQLPFLVPEACPEPQDPSRPKPVTWALSMLCLFSFPVLVYAPRDLKMPLAWIMWTRWHLQAMGILLGEFHLIYGTRFSQIPGFQITITSELISSFPHHSPLATGIHNGEGDRA